MKLLISCVVQIAAAFINKPLCVELFTEIMINANIYIEGLWTKRNWLRITRHRWRYFLENFTKGNIWWLFDRKGEKSIVHFENQQVVASHVTSRVSEIVQRLTHVNQVVVGGVLWCVQGLRLLRPAGGPQHHLLSWREQRPFKMYSVDTCSLTGPTYPRMPFNNSRCVEIDLNSDFKLVLVLFPSFYPPYGTMRTF